MREQRWPWLLTAALMLASAVAAATFGIFHQMLAYMIMVSFSERDWDEPPGTGYLTVPRYAAEGCR